MICTSNISYRRKKWVVPEVDIESVERLANDARIPAIVAQLLTLRGIETAQAAAAFLEPRFRDQFPPELLPNIDAGAQRIAQAVRTREKITLYGDYDVDGITGTAMLWHLLNAAGADVDFYIPHRVDEGYGLNVEAVETLIKGGTRLLVTVDCGCSAVDPIARAGQLGVDVVVSDHHEFGASLPPAVAIVHPRAPVVVAEGAAAFPAYPNPDLCGAGVAYKLAWAVAQKICNSQRVSETFRNLLVEFSALVGLGTIADVVPLVGENRILVKYGLGQLARTQFEGLRAFILAAGYGDGAGKKKLDCMAVGFTLGPRLNAAGRMGHAREAVEMLTTATGTRATEIATWLECQNRDRQNIEKKMVTIARKQVEELLAASGIDSAAGELPDELVVAPESYHAGDVGIDASRLEETNHRPALVQATATEAAAGGAGGANAMARRARFPGLNCTTRSSMSATSSSAGADTQWPAACDCPWRSLRPSERR